MWICQLFLGLRLLADHFSDSLPYSLQNKYNLMFSLPNVFCCRVRVHVIRGRYLSPADSDGLADPYVKVTCGEVVRSSRSQFQPRTVNPSFYQSFELKCRIPGDNLR